jgi:hypothetical protein
MLKASHLHPDSRILKLWGNADRYANPRLVATIASELRLDGRESQNLFEALKKFLFLCSSGTEKLTPSKNIDAAWHIFLGLPAEYLAFCNTSLSKFICHKESANSLATQAQFSRLKNRWAEAFGNEDFLKLVGASDAAHCADCENGDAD